MSNDSNKKPFGRNEFREVASWIGGLRINFTDSEGNRMSDDEAAKAFGQWDPELGKLVGTMLNAQAAVRKHVESKFEPRKDDFLNLKFTV